MINTLKSYSYINKFTVLFSRTDGIGDVILTLPLAGWIKKTYPHAKVLFMGTDYTSAVVE
ncbi:MAG: hypothetical protein LBR36_05200 [Bacteroidales bacterium]|jgi:ADP-heptose:LPS heptosyltransferase|nr:hypothetical protein [Bacteroidales bacterium]